MKSSIPIGKRRLLWRVHFALLLVFVVYGIGMEVVEYFSASRQDSFSVGVAFGLILGAIILLGPVFAEAGYIFQFDFSEPPFWRALFVVHMIFLVPMLVMNAALGYVGLLQVPTVLELFGFLVYVFEMVALWRYAYRCGHLWRAVSPPSDANA
ncbi:MAG: hypothetical protein WBC13_14415 [Dokdonella sp.]|jgi:hypothetical protein|uniref:hypothetical protein n=1 Tax=Dokdonella sp. TaxID=2291710 RepID=UPI002B6877AC|nr:hypothetical protein [Dokdonella sp.]MCC6439434.1 hypothetical protein [Rhodanobacteraceae bacterium]HNV07987.1 hypothetical protein [Dokdonella sp.]HPW03946.1 hypothetical protein [Dokdonella sp.]HQV49297.1 hypothetical protein [Dokdonella sp.]